MNQQSQSIYLPSYFFDDYILEDPIKLKEYENYVIKKIDCIEDFITIKHNLSFNKNYKKYYDCLKNLIFNLTDGFYININDIVKLKSFDTLFSMCCYYYFLKNEDHRNYYNIIIDFEIELYKLRLNAIKDNNYIPIMENKFQIKIKPFDEVKGYYNFLIDNKLFLKNHFDLKENELDKKLFCIPPIKNMLNMKMFTYFDLFLRRSNVIQINNIKYYKNNDNNRNIKKEQINPILVNGHEKYSVLHNRHLIFNPTQIKNIVSKLIFKKFYDIKEYNSTCKWFIKFNNFKDISPQFFYEFEKVYRSCFLSNLQFFSFKRLKEELSLNVNDINGKKIYERFHPPCISYALDRIKLTKQLPHLHKINLLFYGIRIGIPIKNLEILFNNLNKNDFNINHINQAKNKNYQSFNCNKLIENGVCIFKYPKNIYELYENHVFLPDIEDLAKQGRYNDACNCIMEIKKDYEPKSPVQKYEIKRNETERSIIKENNVRIIKIHKVKRIDHEVKKQLPKGFI